MYIVFHLLKHVQCLYKCLWQVSCLTNIHINSKLEQGIDIYRRSHRLGVQILK
jgi:hypothetical protein